MDKRTSFNPHASNMNYSCFALKSEREGMLADIKSDLKSLLADRPVTLIEKK